MDPSQFKNNSRILVVDDDPGIVEILVEILEELDYRVDSAGNGLEACECLKRRSYDLVLTDINMPKMGGIELIREIGKLERPPVVIVITAYASMQSAIDAIKLGVYDYIVKPFNLKMVINAVERALEKCFLMRENVNLKEMMALYRASEMISSRFGLGEVVKVLFEAAAMFTRADFMALYLNHGDEHDGSGDFKLYRRQLLGKKPAAARRFLRFLPQTLSAEQASSYFTRYSSRIFTARDTLLREIRERADQEFPCTSIMAFSLKASNRQVGILLLASLDPRVVFSDKQRRTFYMLVSKAAAAIENTYLYDNLQRHYLETVESFAQALEAKDSYTHGHSRQVSLYAGLLARALGLSASQRALLAQAALLHDIGKIGIADTILNHPGALSRDDLTEIRKHPCKGRNILAPIHSLSGLAEIVYHHHERWDGSGYPDGLAGEEIPLMARIIGIADAFDAITSQRPYRDSLDLDSALAELRGGAGSQFDPGLVELFIAQRDELVTLLKSRHSLDGGGPGIKAAGVG